jgi:uncharacterized RDD family membrane protein YckC
MRNDQTAPRQETLWRNQIAERVAARRARATVPEHSESDAARDQQTRAEQLAQRTVEKLRRRLEERIAREEAERREQEDLERFFAEFNQPIAPPAPVARPVPVPLGQLTSNVIPFPVGAGAAAAATALAPEPIEVHDSKQLTIFEAMPEAATLPEPRWLPPLRLDEHLDFDYEEEVSREAAFELPLKVAPYHLRCWAGMIDGMLVLASSMAFCAIFYALQHDVPKMKVMLAFGVGVTGVLWTVYQILFMAYARATPGLKAMRLGISDFEDRVPDVRRRVFRAISLVLTCMSFGVGFLWSLLDEDRLSWHDRMSRTFPRQLA